MTLELQETLQQKWNDHCESKGYIPRAGMETRYTKEGRVYYLLPGFGRIRFDVNLGWIVVLSVQGWNEDVYQYVKCDATKWSEV